MLDIEKYGFKKTKFEGEYILKFNNESYYLTNLDNIYSLECLEYKMYIFNRYEVDTQEQLDYLMLKGRAGWFFSRILQVAK
jgi:hypothetical protein